MHRDRRPGFPGVLSWLVLAQVAAMARLWPRRRPLRREPDAPASAAAPSAVEVLYCDGTAYGIRDRTGRESLFLFETCG